MPRVPVRALFAVAGRIPKATRHCLRDRSASVALTFAVSVLPLIGVIGAAVDLGFVTQSKAQLDAAADVAALAAATTTANAFTAGQQNYLALGQSAGTQWFSSQGTTVPNTNLPAATVGVTQSGGVFLATVSYQAAVPTYFARLFGYATIPVAGSASATISTNAYVSVTFLLDNSGSMLIAATPAGINTMNTLTTQPQQAKMSQASGLNGYPCSFACHWDAGGNDYYGLARKNNVQLRFDVLQTAVQSAISEMINEQVITNQFGVGIYTFNNSLVRVYPTSGSQTTSTDLSSGIAAAQAIQTQVTANAANSNFPAIMTALASQSTPAGNGSAPQTPKKSLIIVTDGVADYGSRSIPTTEGPINPASCTAMKRLGYNIYVLYTTYITNPVNVMLPFNQALAPYVNGTATPALVPSLQACASAPTNFAQASDPAAINTGDDSDAKGCTEQWRALHQLSRTRWAVTERSSALFLATSGLSHQFPDEPAPAPLQQPPRQHGCRGRQPPAWRQPNRFQDHASPALDMAISVEPNRAGHICRGAAAMLIGLRFRFVAAVISIGQLIVL